MGRGLEIRGVALSSHTSEKPIGQDTQALPSSFQGPVEPVGLDQHVSMCPSCGWPLALVI